MTSLLLALVTGIVVLLPLGFMLMRSGYAHSGAARAGVAAGLLVLLAAWTWWQYERGENIEIADRIALYREDPEAAMRDLADSVERRVAKKGERASMEDLVLLARSREASGELDKAAEVYALANQKSDYSNAGTLVSEAAARLSRHPPDIDSQRVARERIRQALEAAPEHPGANYYAGALALRDGRADRALPHLEVVMRAGVLDRDAQRMLESRIRELRAELGVDADERRRSGEDSPGVRIRIAAGEGMQPERGTLFVAARAPDGPPMPLAAVRVDSPQFPLTVELTDGHRLGDGPPLHSYDELEVSARFEVSGALTQDLETPRARGRVRPADRQEVQLELR